MPQYDEISNASAAALRLICAEDIPPLIDIVRFAYPRIELATSESRERFAQRITAIQTGDRPLKYYGWFRNGTLVGGLRHHDFTMNMFNHALNVGGVGLVATHFLHKREHIAMDMLFAWLDSCAQQGLPIAVLYAFRTDFYHNMGFGMGPQLHHYRIPPARLPKGPTKQHVRLLTESDVASLAACYDRCYKQTHGLMRRTCVDFETWLHSETEHVAAFEDSAGIRGYLVFTFKPAHEENFTVNEIHVREFLYETPAALLELLTFLHSQADQIRHIVWNTQDEYFYTLMADARNGTDGLYPHAFHETNTAGVGLMYRVVDVRGLFRALAAHSFGGETCIIQLTLVDDVLSANNGSTVLAFVDGHAAIEPDGAPYDVEICMNIQEFSSLMMGVVHFKRLLQYGRASISDVAWTNVVHRLFLADDKPLCMTAF